MEALFHPVLTSLVVACLATEVIVARWRKDPLYDPYETKTNVIIQFIDFGMMLAFPVSTFALYEWIYEHRLMTWDFHPAINAVATLLIVEFFYYWSHRYNHQVSLGWATHQVHHTPTRYNLTLGPRLGFTRILSFTWIVFLPMVYLGFHNKTILAWVSGLFFYQFFLHTTYIKKLGFLEYVFNTPSHHRVHHGAHDIYIDKNFGAVLIIYDRLFGTFQAERDDLAPAYGIPEVMAKKSFFYEVFRHWIYIGRALKRCHSPMDAIKVLIGNPAFAENLAKQDSAQQPVLARPSV